MKLKRIATVRAAARTRPPTKIALAMISLKEKPSAMVQKQSTRPRSCHRKRSAIVVQDLILLDVNTPT
jgi:hypothetical protein